MYTFTCDKAGDKTQVSVLNCNDYIVICITSPVNLSPKSPNLDKIATETLFVGNDSHTHPEQHIKNIDDRI